MFLKKLWFLLTGQQEESPSIFQKQRISEDIRIVSSKLPPQNLKQIIPKTFHTIWLDFGEGNGVTDRFLKNEAILKNLHFGWEFRKWKKEDISELIEENYNEFQDIYNTLSPLKKHKFARFLILHHTGGVYLDQDFIPLKNIEPLLNSCSFVVGSEKDTWAPTDRFMASVKHSEVLQNYLKINNEINTDSEILEKAIKLAMEQNEKHGIKVYIKEFFYPVNKEEVKNINTKKHEELKFIFPNSYLFQDFNNLWNEI